MICYKCNHILPKDSNFCQYCGNKVEEVVATPVEEVVVKPKSETPIMDSATSAASDTFVVDGESGLEVKTFDEALNTILNMQTQNTVEAMEANRKTQPDNEENSDFGLVPEKPIFTLARMSVDGEKEYLNQLYTANGDRIQYNRRGSICVEGINGMIDIYDTFLPSGQPYKTIYINMYGSKKSTKAPDGFIFKRATPSTISENNIGKSKSNITRINSTNDRLVSFINISSIVLAIISMLSIIIAMNIQDVDRNTYESLNPTAIYVVLLIVNLTCSISSIHLTKFPIARSLLSFIPALFSTMALLEGSLFSNGHGYYASGHYIVSYMNSELVNALNIIWVLLSYVIFLINLMLPPLMALRSRWYHTVKYREKCYMRVAKMKEYLSKGIINQEEFEKNREEILKNIER